MIVIITITLNKNSPGKEPNLCPLYNGLFTHSSASSLEGVWSLKRLLQEKGLGRIQVLIYRFKNSNYARRRGREWRKAPPDLIQIHAGVHIYNVLEGKIRSHKRKRWKPLSMWGCDYLFKA